MKYRIGLELSPHCVQGPFFRCGVRAELPDDRDAELVNELLEDDKLLDDERLAEEVDEKDELLELEDLDDELLDEEFARELLELGCDELLDAGDGALLEL